MEAARPRTSPRNSKQTAPGSLHFRRSEKPEISARRAVWYKPIPNPLLEGTGPRNNPCNTSEDTGSPLSQTENSMACPHRNSSSCQTRRTNQTPFGLSIGFDGADGTKSGEGLFLKETGYHFDLLLGWVTYVSGM